MNILKDNFMLRVYKRQGASRCYNPITLSSLYAAQYWGNLDPDEPPKASCQVSIKISIFSLTFKSGCIVELNYKAEKTLVPVPAKLKRQMMEVKKMYTTFFFTILTISCKISRSTIWRKILSPQFLLTVSKAWIKLPKREKQKKHQSTLFC